MEPLGTKRCTGCNHLKLHGEFHARSRSRDGLALRCRDCSRLWRRQHYRKNPDKKRNSHLQTRYGLSNDDYETMCHSQWNLCAVCYRPPKTGRWLVVDHDHETGVVRGLLCDKCNTSLAPLEDRGFIEMANDYFARCERWGKYHQRADGEQRLYDTVARAWGK